MYYAPALEELGLTIIRISFGVIFTIFGYNKLMSGSAHLTQLGSAIGLFGITWGHLFWGYAAALTELLGGLAFVLGLYTRIASLPLAFLLIVALRFHLQNKDPFTTWSFAALCLCIVGAFLVAGSGPYSADRIITKCLSCPTSSQQTTSTNSADQEIAHR